MTITIHKELIQGSDEWFLARLGLLTASEMKHAVKKKTDKKTGVVTFSAPDDEKAKAHVWEIAAQRIGKFVEPHYIGDDMLRGNEDEVWAKIAYAEHYAPVDDEVGFITNDKWGVTIGYSPDGLVGDDGCIEVKSRRQRFQIETIVGGDMPDEYLIQVQTALLVSERKWCDFISYSAGHPMITLRVMPNPEVQAAIIEAAAGFERKVEAAVALYNKRISSSVYRTIPTERRIQEDFTLDNLQTEEDNNG